MSQNLETYTAALHTLDAVAQQVPAGAWDTPTCCEGWSARQVAGHAAWVIQAVGSVTGAHARPDEQPEADVAGPDPAATIRSSMESTLAALDDPDVLATVTQTPFGEMAIDDFLGGIWVDAITHAWDIADATGVDHGIDEQTAADAQRALEPLAGMLRGPGRFGEALDTDSDSALDRFIAFTGRRSARTR